jgi:hypothetical protein
MPIAQRQHRLPLIFLFASRPEQYISLAFSTGILPSVTTCIALDESYLPDKDVRLFLTDKIQELKSTHRLRTYIPLEWPLPNVLNQLVRKSSGQFIYVSTVIHYISSIRHKPTDRLNIVVGICPPQRDLPFAELDVLYTHIFTGMEDIEPVLDILSLLLLSPGSWLLPEIEEFLFLQPGDAELYLGDISSLMNIGPNQRINILHASLTDFFIDPTRSKELWINQATRHSVFARRCLQSLQLNGKRPSFLPLSQFIFPKEHIKLFMLAYDNTTYHLENAEMTTELREDLINFSFDILYNVFKNYQTHNPTHRLTIHRFIPPFLECLKKLVCYHFHSCILSYQYLCILQYSHCCKQIISVKLFEFTLTACFVMTWKNIIHFQD